MDGQMTKRLKITPDTKPWFVLFDFPFDLRLKDYLKEFPGVSPLWHKDGKFKAWRVPIELVEFVKPAFRRAGYET
jgi:hypothetical protein